jgi:hypothetical protein
MTERTVVFKKPAALVEFGGGLRAEREPKRGQEEEAERAE